MIFYVYRNVEKVYGPPGVTEESFAFERDTFCLNGCRFGFYFWILLCIERHFIWREKLDLIWEM